MRTLATALLLAAMLLGAPPAGAIDVPVDADGLVLRRNPGGREVLEFMARDAVLVPEQRSGDDPSRAGGEPVLVELFGGDGSTASFAIPTGSGIPGWRAREGKRQPPSFRYLNPWAPDGPSSVKVLVLREGEGLMIVGRAVGLPLGGETRGVGIRVTLGSLRLCALFDESTVVHDRPGKFAARNALAAGLTDCEDASLTLPLESATTTTAPPTSSSTSSSTSTTSTTSTSTSSSTTSSTSTSSSSSTSSSTSTSTSSTTSTTIVGTTFGYATEFAGASSHSPGFLLGIPVQLSTAVTVTHLGVIAKAGGANVLLGLYRSSGGVPTTLVVGTPVTPLVPGRIEVPVTQTLLTAGTYWLMAMYDTDASVGLDTSVANAPAMYAFRDFGQGLPSSVSLPSSMFGQRYNYYLRAIP